MYQHTLTHTHTHTHTHTSSLGARVQWWVGTVLQEDVPTHTHALAHAHAHAHAHTHTHTHTSSLGACVQWWVGTVLQEDVLAHTHTRTRTHTHTHVGFYGLRGLSIGVMVFILYKLYVLLPYTYPTPKLSPHRRRCISIFPQKNSLCMIYKRFKLWGHWKCPHKSPSPCNTYVIPMSLYKFVSS